jgi:hypothetical protein
MEIIILRLQYCVSHRTRHTNNSSGILQPLGNNICRDNQRNLGLLFSLDERPTLLRKFLHTSAK